MKNNLKDMKNCSKCKKNKNLDDFCKNKSSKDGRNNICRKCDSEKRLKYYEENKESEIQKRLEYQKSNPQNRTEYIREYEKNRRLVDVNYRLKKYLRNRVNAALKNGYKTGSAVSDLGCSIEQLKSHIESQFKIGMNWENHGKWHIDHIAPLANFDLSNREEFLVACNYKNLQPLWAEQNRIKGNR